MLHFRCYVAMGNVKDAEKLFHQLDLKAGKRSGVRLYGLWADLEG